MGVCVVSLVLHESVILYNSWLPTIVFARIGCLSDLDPDGQLKSYTEREVVLLLELRRCQRSGVLRELVLEPMRDTWEALACAILHFCTDVWIAFFRAWSGRLPQLLSVAF